MTTRAYVIALLWATPQAVFAKLGDGTTEAVTGGSIVQMLAGLAVVLAILIGGALLLRQIGRAHV